MGFFDIPDLGSPLFDSPLHLSKVKGDKLFDYVRNSDRVKFNIFTANDPSQDDCVDSQYTNEDLEIAGPREKIFFDPGKCTCAIVTCGGLCPGLNNVIRSIVFELFYHYKITNILGIRYGFAGLNPAKGHEPVQLTPAYVDYIHDLGGSVLGSSRGAPDVAVMVDELERLGVDILFSVGGDGTQRGNYDIYKEITRRGKKIAVVGIPKTIDNDIHLIEKSFGFETAVTKATEAIRCAHMEARGAYNGVGLVKLMGRDSGYIAAYASVAINEVNFVLIPEVPFDLYGDNGFLETLRKRLEARHHAVIVVSEGAGQQYFKDYVEYDSSGNKLHGDIGILLNSEIKKYMKDKGVEVSVKYFDPSYIIRSVPATAGDSVFCNSLARNAVHAGMAGKTGLLIGWRKTVFVHIPLDKVVNIRKMINPEGGFWFSVLEATGQPNSMTNQ